MATKSKLEELNITQDELKRIGDALKDEKFREMFCEYAQEISDPENRRRYEEEIAQMERERGMDVTFIRPEPGYVLKTSVNGEKKAFINISKSDKIDKPSAERKQNDQGKSGLMWHIPHSFAPPREDHDKQKNRCQVYDFVVHPDTYRMAESNARFKKLVEDTAMDGIEKQFQVKIDRKNVKQPKMQFKGVPSATVIRNRNSAGPQTGVDTSGLLKDMPYPYDDKSTQEKMKEREQRVAREQEKNKNGDGSGQTDIKKDGAAVPNYTIIHRSDLDMQEYRNAPDSKPSTRPRELVIKIELPLLKSAAQANLDIFEQRLSLESSPPAAYKLDLTLPYPVDDSKGNAKFDKQKRTLVVTLPVVPVDLPSIPSFTSDDTAGTAPDTNGISSGSVNQKNILPEKPLIEVLSDRTDPSVEDDEPMLQKDTQPQEQKNDGGEHLTCPGSVSNGDSGKLFSPSVSYSLPDFSFTQDTETISFVLKVKNVAENFTKEISPSSNEVDFVCTSQGEGGFPMHFRIFLRFAESCKVVPEHCTVDVTTENVVLLLLKDRSSRGLWDQFWAGLHSDNLEKHLFLTTSNLQQQLKELDESSTDMGQTPTPTGPAETGEGPSCSLEVTAMSEKKLTVKISPSGKSSNKKRGEEEDDEYDPPSSAEIEVVHSHPKPSLHGILKQQTVSESSEEVSHDADSPHTSNEEEEDLSPTPGSPGKRRTVSFNKHIDRATFKTSASVNSMKTSLKSKRKRQRKLEEKKDKNSSRRRHNSAGSEGSCDDNTHSMSEEEALAGEEKRRPQNQSEVDVPAAQNGLDFRTKPSTSEPTSDDGCEEDVNPNGEARNHKKADKISGDGESLRETREMVASGHNGSTVDTGSISNAQSMPDIGEGNSGEGNSTGSRKGGSVADRIRTKLAESSAGGDHCADSDDEEEGGKDGHNEGSPDTSLSGQRSCKPADTPHNEHRTECAFQFSNQVMFDLDVE
ncbi:protein kintoun-like [Babylonia areolata]|uniref:protein kintoun-like n=1 Tax=Babylonia areolata TaxID=304850 RepID=UPI003FCF2442